MGAPAVSPEKFSTFGDLLKYLRKREELTQRELAIVVGYSDSEISRIEKNQSVPDAATIKALFVPALHLEHEPQWVERLLELVQQARLGELPETTKPVASNNLPASLSTFIGREKEQAEILRLIDTHRLVTLTGSGGVGKTRLALKVGGQVLDEYANGVWLAELASLSDPVLLAQTVASMFGIVTQSTSVPHTELLINFLRARMALLILDNCEHLLDACASLSDTLLKHCPQLKILATSREPLGLTGEAIYHVPSLGLPHFEQVLDRLREFESVRLFEERAQLVQTDFSLTMENASFIVRICSRLDGVPLALELAAAKVSMLSAQQIAEQLDKSFNLLTGGSRTALPRQQTIRASIDWSWSLLLKSERTFLRQLSVFAGGWTLESAQAVCDGDVLELTSALVKKSLIEVQQEAGHRTRYRFHEIVRQYARAKLVEASEEGILRTRHLKYFLQLSEQAELALKGPAQMEWFARLNTERDNIRAALEWADQTDVEAGLHLSSRLEPFWQSLDLREGARWLSQFLGKPESHAYPRTRAKALYEYGRIMDGLQQLDAARLAAHECLELYRKCGDQKGEVDGLLLLGWEVPNTAEKAEFNQKALELAQSLGDVRRETTALWQLGASDQSKNRFVYWEKSIALTRTFGDLRELAVNLSILGYFLVLNGDLESAQKYLDESSKLYGQLNIKPVTSALLSAYGQIALLRGDFEKARAYLLENARIGEEQGHRQDYLWSRAHLGYVFLQEGMIDEARQIFVETVLDFQKDGNPIGVIFTLESMAGLYASEGKMEPAARLIGWADAARERIGDTRPLLEQADADKIIAACIAKIGEIAFSDAYDEGQKMTFDEAVAYSLEVS